MSLSISGDGGLTFSDILRGLTSNVLTITVPELSSNEARIRVSRSFPFSSSESPGFFMVAPGLVSPWWDTTVDATGGTVGEHTSLALDSRDRPRISYYDSGSGELEYAARADGAWNLETVDTGNVGEYSSLAIDESAIPHIAYYDAGNEVAKYAVRSGGSWATEFIDVAFPVGEHTSLALDPQGVPHVSYFYQATGALKYANRMGGVWNTEVADNPGGVVVGRYSSIAVDRSGAPHVSYRDDTFQALRYATKAGLGWNVEIVDPNDNAGFFTSIAVDDAGRPHIGYQAQSLLELRYATKTEHGWIIETVDDSGWVGEYTSIVLDNLGNPWISYADGIDFTLKVARRIGGFWKITVVDDAPFVAGRYSSLALDSDGNPRISYHDAANGALKYASSAIEVESPPVGDTWQVGSSRTIEWNGTGPVNILLSIDGGSEWSQLARMVSGGSHAFVVPHVPSRFARVMLERSVPYSTAESESLFTIEADIALLSLKVGAPQDLLGVEISWETNPGPEDLAGYRLDRKSPGTDWTTLVVLTRETAYLDRDGSTGDRYRLYAVNGFGRETLLGEAGFLPPRPLAAWPNPLRGGEMRIAFATTGGLGGGAGEVVVSVHDLRGRRLAILADRSYEAGHHLLHWDGRDDQGNLLAGGVYFLRVVNGREARNLKFIVIR